MSSKSKKTPQWITIINRRGPLLFNNFVIFGQSQKYFKKMLDFDFENRNFKYVDGEISIDLNEMNQLRNIIEQKIKEKPKFLAEFIERCSDQCKKLLDISKQIYDLKNLEALTNDELRELFEKYMEEVLKIMPFLNIFSIMERMFEEKITQKIKKKLEAIGKSVHLDEYQRNLIFPSEDNFVIKEIDELIEISAEIQSKVSILNLFKKPSEEIEKELPGSYNALFLKLYEHAKTFGFLNMYTYQGNPMSVKDVIDRLKSLLETNCSEKLQKINKQKQEAKKKYKAIIKELQISGELLRLIEYARKYLYFRLYRLDVLFIAGFYVREFLQEIAKRMRLNYADIINLWHREIINFFKNSTVPKKAKLRERKEGYATFLINNKLEIFSGNQLSEFRAIKVEAKEEIKKIKGTIACSGKHRGIVKIVISASHIDKVKRGNVLVSTMTNPYYVPAMIRAGAIVTDEGGILSHASIISRELNIPCIVGTNISTKLLKDGDLIEIDATGVEGIITILQHSI